MKTPKAICLVSGGMDSLVTAAIAHTHYPGPGDIAFLHLNYAQKTERKELECFHLIADHYQVPMNLRKVIDISFLKHIGGSSLTDQGISVKEFQNFNHTHAIPDSYVPFRNTLIISMAVSWAEVLGAKQIFIGAVYEDSSGYPDCRPSYYEAMNKLISEGTKEGDIRVVTPVIYLRKEEIVKKAYELKAPLEFTWSCYAREDEACGVCDSCALRLRGFEKAGAMDPIPYASRPSYFL